MSIISVPFTFSAGAVIIAGQHNSNFSTIYSDYNGNIQNVNIAANAGIGYSKLTLSGSIVNSDISSGAAITDSKLATISTAGKVDGASLTDFAAIPSGAGIIPSANLSGFIPSGGIIMWSGTIATIPSGWVLCNGSNSTPDLRNQFIVGADADVSGIAKSTVTGSALQTSSGQIPSTSVSFSHSIGFGISGTGGGFSTGGPNNAGTVTATVGTGSLNIAVFYALAFIMKT